MVPPRCVPDTLRFKEMQNPRAGSHALSGAPPKEYEESTELVDVAAGAQVVVRDEEWLVRSVTTTQRDGARVEVTGISELVRDQEAVFFENLEKLVGPGIEVLDPRQAILVPDDTPGFRNSRLWLESLLRQAPAPSADTRIQVGDRGLFNHLNYQLRPAQLALENLQPRILIGDAVGLGKTLEIGIVLSELIKRGRGERILVVTPRAVLEQFQHELWTRFAIPLVRLDSDGIQKVRRELPADRNPFSYYRRVIVSIDTLKNPAKYRHHLDRQRWDAVVIDECHNLINTGTQNNRLARLLARQADALILSSATPHNGKPESFAELVSMLDPSAIADKREYTAKDIAHLYVRRHRNSLDVKAQVGHNWAQRKEPTIIPVTPTGAEQAVLEELGAVWLHPADGMSVLAHRNQRLVPWGFLKAFLSSPAALVETVSRRARTTDYEPEKQALIRLRNLADDAAATRPSKLTALFAYLRDMGVAADSDTRVVIFSERIKTLYWLKEELIQALKMKPQQLEVLHAAIGDSEVQRIVEQFALEGSPLRILLTSDMASEGINLHRQCHHLIHFDLPWSFIRIQQRNGRIDRYLQTHEPRIAALALTSPDLAIDSDLQVVTKLLRKEHAANQALGDAGVLLDLHDAAVEEDAVMKALADGQDLDDVAPDPASESGRKQHAFSWMLAAGAQHEGAAPTAVARPMTLFADDDNYLAEALRELFPDQKKLNVTRDENTDLLAFDTPTDLQTRLRALPEEYLRGREVLSRIRLSANTGFAEQRLAEARKSGTTLWPDVHFLAPLHPVLDWVASRCLARLGRNEAPVMVGNVNEPTFLTQAVWSGADGHPVIATWGAVTGLPSNPMVRDMAEAISTAGMTEHAVNAFSSGGVDLDTLHRLVPSAIDAATADLTLRREDLERDLDRRLVQRRDKLGTWQQHALDLAADLGLQAGKRRDEIGRIYGTVEDLIASLKPTGRPYVRVVGVIVPSAQPGVRTGEAR